jgi:hypothetical protein
MFYLNLVGPSFCRPRQTNEIKSHDFVSVKKLSAEQKIETEKTEGSLIGVLSIYQL